MYLSTTGTGRYRDRDRYCIVNKSSMQLLELYVIGYRLCGSGNFTLQDLNGFRPVITSALSSSLDSGQATG